MRQAERCAPRTTPFGLLVRNMTSGNDGAFDLLQIFDVTSQVDQCSNP